MTIVNINDIEDLILAKHEIDLILNEKGELEGRSNLQDFMRIYGSPDYIYLIGDKQIPFKYIKFDNNDFLFITDTDEVSINIVKTKLKLIKYNLDNLVKLSRSELATKIDMDNVIIHNNNYYM